ncbi:hypothetical protein EZV62_003280 [Acer yangbiense]|uniref:DUF4220 domain-containing protein n=1 Tax=Acer yangbiense TaxID=1000413 RepID=A0A5C7IH21_9ROSI|nr:hypothetical protein EZV62_003280 [Acer yangbiense]
MPLFLEKLIKIWNGWEVRVLILGSLILQIILIIFGSRRKFTASVKVRIPVWSAYLIADSVASLSLGNLAKSKADCDNKLSELDNALQAFWVPFLLLHLGGPDTITAYSLEDNKLWLRHFLGLVVQVGVAFYVFFKSWSNNALTFIAIPMFITGIIKYGERTFVLRSSSADFKESKLSSPLDLPQEYINPASSYLFQAYFLFKSSAYLFANMVLDYYGPYDLSYPIMHNISAEDAFKLVEAELGFMYDILYTKATIVYSRLGIFLRCISFVSSISALIVFSIIIEIHDYPIADISLTYSLLVAAVFLEIYALILFLLSDWTKMWLIKLKTSKYNPTSRKLLYLPLRVLSYFHSATVTDSRKRWSKSMALYSLISYCLKDKSATYIVGFISKLVDIKYWYLNREDIDAYLQKMIFKQLKEKNEEILKYFDDYVDKSRSLKTLLDRRGDYVLKRMGISDGFQWCTTDLEFDHSLLVWHIATDLYYYHAGPEHPEGDNKFSLQRKISKHLSDYMLYLLVFCPSMLPKGISFETNYEDTCKAIKSTIPISKEKSDDGSSELASACKVLLQYYEKDEQVQKDPSVLHRGCRLAKTLQSHQVKWEMISEIWIEMLTYAANRCAWKEHEQQLTNGGELLTHVSLLMAHLGLSEQYEMKKKKTEHIRALPDREWQHLL